MIKGLIWRRRKAEGSAATRGVEGGVAEAHVVAHEPGLGTDEDVGMARVCVCVCVRG